LILSFIEDLRAKELSGLLGLSFSLPPLKSLSPRNLSRDEKSREKEKPLLKMDLVRKVHDASLFRSCS